MSSLIRYVQAAAARQQSNSELGNTRLACAQIIGRTGISLFAFVIHVLLVPTSYAYTPLLAHLAFAILVFVRRKSPVGIKPLPPLSAARVVLFSASHVLLLSIAFLYGADLGWKTASYSLAGTSFAALKLLILLPTIVLFPLDRAFVRLIAPELIAALVVLFTFNPVRYFQLLWPMYSDLLGAAITRLSALFVPDVNYVSAADGVVVTGPLIDLHVEFSCSGVNGVYLFQLVFAMIVAVEWNRLAKLRALICYASGAFLYLLTNALRLLIANLSGNLWSPRTVDTNTTVSFIVTFIAIVLICYKWMVPQKKFFAHSRTTASHTPQ